MMNAFLTPSCKGKSRAILAGVPRPRVLVTGHISERIDWPGIIGALSERPEWSWVLAGPADEGMQDKVAAVTANDNARLGTAKLVLLPSVAVEHVPGLIQHCDACAVPYRLNPFTLASSPLKAVEYLAMGAPVRVLESLSLNPYGHVIHWVEPGVGASYAKALDSIRREGRDSELANLRRSTVTGQSTTAKTKAFRAIVLAASPSQFDPAAQKL